MSKEPDKKIIAHKAEAGLKTHIVRDLEQAKLMMDPLKLKIIQAFAGGPKTTKQVAESIGESPTKLYRHVDALMQSGLLELIEERPKRGTVEKYLQAIASKFVIDPNLFTPEDQQSANSDTLGVIDSILDLTKEEMSLLSHEQSNEEIEHVLMRAQIQAPKEKIKELRQLLIDWIDTCQKLNSSKDSESDDLDYAATIAFYPIKQDRD